MGTIAVDTYKAVQNLKNAGLEEGQAAAIVAVMRWAVTGQYTSYAKWFPKSDVVETSDCTGVAARSGNDSL